MAERGDSTRERVNVRPAGIPRYDAAAQVDCPTPVKHPAAATAAVAGERAVLDCQCPTEQSYPAAAVICGVGGKGAVDDRRISIIEYPAAGAPPLIESGIGEEGAVLD